MKLLLSDGSSTKLHDCTITVLSSASKPQLSVGNYHTLVLDQNGDLYAWGQGSGGKLGLGNGNNATTPQQISAAAFAGEEVLIIYAGMYTSAFITRSGKVYGAGGSTFGMLSPEAGPTILTIDDVVRIAFQRSAALFIKSDGSLYSYGPNNLTGTGRSDGANSNEYYHITSTGPSATSGILLGKLVIEIQSAWNSFLVLTADGNIYGFGGNIQGELGLGNTSIVYSPQWVTDSAKKIFGSISQSLFYLSTSDVMYGAGDNQYGQLGRGNTTDRTSFTSIDYGVKTPQHLVLGNLGAHVLMTDHSFFGFGLNHQRQVARANVGTYPTPELETTTFNGNIVQFGTGRTHTVVLTDQGNLYGVGQNHLGQVGSGTSSQINDYLLISLNTLQNSALPSPTLPSETLVTDIQISTFNIIWSSYNLDGFEELL